jgi:hypothetical protein
VIDENQPQCESAKQIEPQLPLAGSRHRHGRRRNLCRFARHHVCISRQRRSGNSVGY